MKLRTNLTHSVQVLLLMVCLWISLSVGIESYSVVLPFIASWVFVFAMPMHPTAQPINVFLGHFVASAVGLVLALSGESNMLLLVVSVAVAMGFMSMFGVSHPPAAIDPVFILLGGNGLYLLAGSFVAFSLVLLLFACLVHHQKRASKYSFLTSKKS